MVIQDIKVKRSKNYYKCKNKLATLHSKLKNVRNYYLYNITKKITDMYDIITCEKLSVKNMLKEHNLSKKINDASFHEIIRQLEYKSKYKNKLFYQIDEYYPSSQECNVFGNIDKKYKDLNASINIVFEGLKLYMKEVNI